MKKNLLACALVSAFAMAGAAQAASVELYGTVDTGLLYTHESVETNGVSEDSDNFGMESGIGTSSVVGIRGTEEISENLSVGFVLEHSFASDTGADDNPDHFFDKEAQVSVSGTAGTLSMGRMGGLTAGEGTYDLFMATGDAMDGGYVDYIGAGYWMSRDIYDNTVTYQSPEFAGFTVYGQYSFGTEGDDSVASRSKTRYAAIGLGYTAGNFSLAVVGDTVLKNRSFESGYKADIDDAMSLSIGMNYDFGIAKPFIGFQYGKHEETIGGYDFTADDAVMAGFADEFTGDLDGYAVAVGSAFPVFGGELQVSAYYADGDGDLYFYGTEDTVAKADVTRYGIGVFHNYELSKRTSLYAGVGYDHQEVDYVNGAVKHNVEREGVQVGLGITHNF